MNFFHKQKLNVRLNILISTLFVAMLLVLSFVLLQKENNKLLTDSKRLVDKQVEELSKFYSLLIEANLQKVNEALVVSSQTLNSMGEIVEDNTDFIELQITSQMSSQEKKNIRIPKWYINTKPIYENENILNEIHKIANAEITIFQKIPDGYLRIATTENNSNRAVGTFLPNSSEVVQSVERGLLYHESSFDIDEGYLAAYEPLFLNDEIKGMLYVGVKKIDEVAINNLFATHSIEDYGYPLIIDKNGKILIPPNKQVENIGQKKFFKRFSPVQSVVKQIELSAEEQKFLFNKQDVSLGFTEKIIDKLRYFTNTSFYLHYKYNAKTKDYIVFTRNVEKVLQQSTPFRDTMAGFIFLSILIVSIVIPFLIVNPMVKRFRKMTNVIEELSKGHSVEKITNVDTHESVQIANLINKLIEGMNSYVEFAQEIGSRNFSYPFTPLSENDILGNSLLLMRKNLKAVETDRQRREDADKGQKWVDAGLSKFDEILRFHDSGIEKLAYTIVSNLVKYLNANQGGVFLLTKPQGEKDEQLELIASYAYNKERNLKKTLHAKVGLLGRSVIEKKILHFTEIPDDYIQITSGLGGSNPTHLVIIPLIENQEVLGVIEIASFVEINKVKLQFIEKVSMSIAKTIASAKINAQTAKLLEKSQEQSEELASQEEEMRQNLEELQATQEASMRRETELRGLLNALNASTLVVEFNMEGKILNINENLLNLLGVQQEQVIGKKHEMFLSHEEKQEYERIREQLNAGDTVKKTTHLVYLNLDIWLSETYTPILDDEGIPYKYIDIAVDITENIVYEKKLQKQKNQLEKRDKELEEQFGRIQEYKVELEHKEAEKNRVIEALYESSLIAEYDINGFVTDMSTSFLKLYEISKEQIKGAHHRDFTSMGEKSRAFAVFWQDLRKGNKRTLDELIRLPSGKKFWISQNFTPIFDENGKAYKILNIAIDITSKKVANV